MTIPLVLAKANQLPFGIVARACCRTPGGLRIAFPYRLQRFDTREHFHDAGALADTPVEAIGERGGKAGQSLRRGVARFPLADQQRTEGKGGHNQKRKQAHRQTELLAKIGAVLKRPQKIGCP